VEAGETPVAYGIGGIARGNGTERETIMMPVGSGTGPFSSVTLHAEFRHPPALPEGTVMEEEDLEQVTEKYKRPG
jgi:hypothetical protein